MIKRCLYIANFFIECWLLRDFSDYNEVTSLDEGLNFSDLTQFLLRNCL
jgi:hypothetical protein